MLFRSVLIPVALVVIGAVLALLLASSRDDIPRRGSEFVPPLVETQRVNPGPLASSIRSRGMVRPLYEIDLVTEVSGKVVWVDPAFVQGGFVQEGQALLRIDPIEYEVALSDARAAVASAEFALTEVQVIVRKAAIEEAEAKLAAAKARLRQAEADLANTEISAPFDAVVDSKQVDLGQYVQTGMSVMRLMSTGLAEVRLPILGADVAFVGLEPDQEAMATLSARLGAETFLWEAQLVRLEQRLDVQTRVYFLVAQVAEPYNTERHGQVLPLGQFVEANFEGRVIEDATLIPRRALLAGDAVYVVRDELLQRQFVTVVRHEGNAVIVSGGLRSGDVLVTSQLDIMVEGMPVRVEPEA